MDGEDALSGPRCEGGAVSGAPGGAKMVKLAPRGDTIAAGDTLKVDLFVNGVYKARGVQFTIDAVTADGKNVEFVDWSIDTSEGNYLFAGHETYSAVDSNRGRLLIVSAEGSVDCEDECYVATALFIVTADTSGPVTLELNQTHSQLRDTTNQLIQPETITAATVTVIGE